MLFEPRYNEEGLVSLCTSLPDFEGGPDLSWQWGKKVGTWFCPWGYDWMVVVCYWISYM